MPACAQRSYFGRWLQIGSTSMVVVRLNEITGILAERPISGSNDAPDDDDAMLVTFDGDRAHQRYAYRKLWGMVVLLALRDKASSVHYHPWRGGGALAMIVENVRYEMVPPPHEYADVCMEVARTLFTQPRRSGLFSRLWQHRLENTVSSTVRIEWDGWTSFWDAVCWSSGERAGVELYLITPLHVSIG